MSGSSSDSDSKEPTSDAPDAAAPFIGRGEVLKVFRRKHQCDLLVLGGNLDAVTLSHLAAFNGIRTVLLCSGDYTDERYSTPCWQPDLNQLGLFQAYRWFAGLSDLLQVAPHLVARASEGKVAPVVTGGSALMAWVEKLFFPNLHSDSLSLRADRLLIERILAAKQEGAFCLNYVELSRLHKLARDKLIAVCRSVLLPERDLKIELEPAVVLDFREAASTKAQAWKGKSAQPPYSFSYHEGRIAVAGGTLPEAAQNAMRLLKFVGSLSSSFPRLLPIAGRPLRGAADYRRQADLFMNRAHENGLDQEITSAVLSRLGARVKYLSPQDGAWKLLTGAALRAEVDLMLETEDVLQLEDLVQRRLGISPSPDEFDILLTYVEQHLAGAKLVNGA
jgi:hypothetical protein